jgi:hypothetical protein
MGADACREHTRKKKSTAKRSGEQQKYVAGTLMKSGDFPQGTDSASEIFADCSNFANSRKTRREGTVSSTLAVRVITDMGI